MLVCAASYLQNTSVREFETLLEHLLKLACNIASTQQRETYQPIIQFSLLNCTRLVCFTTQVLHLCRRGGATSPAPPHYVKGVLVFVVVSAKQVLFAGGVLHAVRILLMVLYNVFNLPCSKPGDEIVHSQQNTQVSVVTTGHNKIEQVSDQEVDLRTGNHSHIESELPSTDRPTDEFELSTTNLGSMQELKQIFEEESATLHCNSMCTGRQRLLFSPSYQTSLTFQPHSFSDLQQLAPNHLPGSHRRCQNSRKLGAPDAPKTNEEYSDMDCGLWQCMFRNNDAPEDFYASSIQETLERPGQMQELVLNNHTITFSHRPTCTTTRHCYIYTELSALERRELYIKPFFSLAPE